MYTTASLIWVVMLFTDTDGAVFGTNIKQCQQNPHAVYLD